MPAKLLNNSAVLKYRCGVLTYLSHGQTAHARTCLVVAAVLTLSDDFWRTAVLLGGCHSSLETLSCVHAPRPSYAAVLPCCASPTVLCHAVLRSAVLCSTMLCHAACCGVLCPAGLVSLLRPCL